MGEEHERFVNRTESQQDDVALFCRCPVGTFSNSTGLTGAQQCTPCLPGSYCGSSGLSQPSGSCRGGYYCLTGAVSMPHPSSCHVWMLGFLGTVGGHTHSSRYAQECTFFCIACVLLNWLTGACWQNLFGFFSDLTLLALSGRCHSNDM